MIIDKDRENDASTATISADALMALRSHLKIVHHIPGRLRVRVSKAALKVKRGFSLGGFRRFIEDLGDVRLSISAPTLSAVLEYDPKQMPPGLWDNLIDGSEDNARSAFASLTKAA